MQRPYFESWLLLIFGQITKLLSIELAGIGINENSHVPGLVSLRYSVSLDIALYVRGSDSLHLKMFINTLSWVFWSFRGGQQP